MKNRKINKIFICFMLFLSPFLSMADDIGDGNDGGDVIDTVPVAPIDNYIPLVVVAAIGFGYAVIRRRNVRI